MEFKKKVINPGTRERLSYIGNRARNRLGEGIIIEFTKDESTLGHLTLSNVSGVKLFNVPDTIKVLELKNVPYRDENKELFDNLPTLFPNLSKLVMTNCVLWEIPKLPNNLLYLNVARNSIKELPSTLPTTLHTVIASRNILTTINNDLPKGINVLSVSRNRIRPETVIDLNLKVLHCDYTRNIDIAGKVHQLKVGRVVDEEIKVSGSIYSVALTPIKLKGLKLPKCISNLVVDRDVRGEYIPRIEIKESLPKLRQIINHTKCVVRKKLELTA